jgi:hypothetical protein
MLAVAYIIGASTLAFYFGVRNPDSMLVVVVLAAFSLFLIPKRKA